jgi:hypothetical protein
MISARSTLLSRLTHLVVSRSVLTPRALIAAALAATSVVGCVPFGDPGGPGAEGQISVDPSTAMDGLTTLRLRAAPAESDTFNSKAPVFPAAGGEGSTWFADGSGQDLATLTFPFDYSVGDALGTTPVQRWRVFAWFSAAASEVTVTAPASGEPYGTATFELDGCGSYGDYCGTKAGVDLTIDQSAP